MNNLLVTVASQFHLLPRPFHISNYSKFYIGTITELHFATSPTEGFISLPLNQSNFVILRPYDVPEDQRYSRINGVHKLWVYSTDKPHSGADVCGGYGGLQPGVFFLKFFFIPVIKSTPPT